MRSTKLIFTSYDMSVLLNKNKSTGAYHRDVLLGPESANKDDAKEYSSNLSISNGKHEW